MSLLSPRLAALAVASAFSLVVACTGSTTVTGFSGDSDGGLTGLDGSSKSPGSSSGDSGTTTPSCADPTCPLEICSCKDDSFAGTNGVCRSGGECDAVGACDKACGAVGYADFAYDYPACSSAIDCTISDPNVSCMCNEGYGYNAYPTCNAGHCTTAPEYVCPAACKNDSGWAGCASAADCAPIICACKDGTNPATASPCSDGACSTSSVECPSLCASRGGWSGSVTTTPDAGGGGGMGPKPPGSTCSKGSECQAFDCTCKNGSVFTDNAACDSGQCATQADVCGLSCLSSGGWSGS